MLYNKKKLIEQMEDSDKLQEDLLNKMSEADEAGKSEDSEKLKKEYDQEVLNYKSLDSKLDITNSRLERQAKIKAEKEDLSDDDDNDSDPEGKEFKMVNGKKETKVQLEAKNRVKEEQEKETFFYELLSGGTNLFLQNRGKSAYELMRSKNNNFKEGKTGIKLPKSIINGIFGRQIDRSSYMGGKAISADEGPPILSSQNSPGNLIPEDFRNRLLQLPPEPPYLFELTTRMSSSTGEITWPQLEQDHDEDTLDEYGGVTVQWIAEGATKPYTEPRFTQAKVQTNEIAGRTEISRTMLRRSALDLQAIITRLFRGALLNELDKTILAGDGIGKPLGVMNDPNVRTTPRLNKDNVQYEDLVNLEFCLLGHHRANANYVLADQAMKKLKLQKDNDGQPLFSVDTSQQMRSLLAGYPFRSTHRLTLGTDDVVFGDWGWYFTAVEEDVVMLMSEHEKFSQNLVVFAVFALFGGKPIIPSAFCKLNPVNS